MEHLVTEGPLENIKPENTTIISSYGQRTLRLKQN